MAQNKGLGGLLSEHKTTAGGFVKLALIMLASLAVASLLLGIGIFGGDSNIGGRIILSILGLLFLLPVGLGTYGLVRSRDNAIRLHENGIAIRKGGVDTALLWDDIASYDAGHAFLILGTNDDQSFEFGMDGLRGGNEIVAKLREEVTAKRVVPRIKAALLEGNAAPFESDGEETTGATDGVIDVPGFTFDVEGVTPMGSNDRVPWSAITGCRVEEKIEGRGKLRQVTTYVVLSTATQNLRTVMNSMSDREACMGVCRAMTS